MSAQLKFLIFAVALFLPAILFIKPAISSSILKPQLTWQRSTEDQNKIIISNTIATGVNAALSLPLEGNQIVFDNGQFTPQENKSNVPVGNSWASWKKYLTNPCGSNFELRHFQAKFTLPQGLTVTRVILASPYYTDPTATSVLPINDNAYIFLNGSKIATVGTSYNAGNRGFAGSSPIANETDGWFGNGDFGSSPANNLHAGENTLDIVAEEWCLWGGMGNLELKLEVEGTNLNVPYFNQTSSPWGSQEYNSGNSLSLFCGRTIAQCGCALTSAAMLLRYYGVDKAPNGQPTTPETLNNWLKANKGYVGGDINWLAVAGFAKKVHDVFGTPIVDYVGRVKTEDFSLLNNDLNNNKPVILQEPGHYIVTTGITGSTYLINDPRWREKTNLTAYGNHFQEMRRYALTHTNLSGILITTDSPTQLSVIDSQGLRTGIDQNIDQIVEEIPNTSYYLQTPLIDDSFENSPQPPQNTGTFFFEALDPIADQYRIIVSGDGNYAITFRGYDENAEVSEQILQGTGPTQYILNYSPEPGSQIQVTQIVNIDIKPGSDQNPINLDSSGIIPVAILTTLSFDATQVDVSTVKFGPGEAKEIHNKGHLEDVDGDGDLDMVLHFKTKDAGIQHSDTQACFTGTTLEGKPIQGCDSVTIVH